MTSFGWALSAAAGQSLLHMSRPACRVHSSSCRAEGCGVLFVLRFAHRAGALVVGAVKALRLHCDNLSAARSSKQTPEEWKCAPNSSKASDCDVLAEIWATRRLIHEASCSNALRTKGHQDGKTESDPLELPAQLNVDADKPAGDHIDACRDTDFTRVPALPAGGVQPNLPASAITCNLKVQLGLARTAEPMKQRAIKKCHWDEDTFNDIECEAHHRAGNCHHKRQTSLNKRSAKFLSVGKLVSRRDALMCRSGCHARNESIQNCAHVCRCPHHREWRVNFLSGLRGKWNLACLNWSAVESRPP